MQKSQLNFSGYRIGSGNHRNIEFYLPAHAPNSNDEEWALEYYAGRPSKSKADSNEGRIPDPKRLKMSWDGKQWLAHLPEQEARGDVFYRFVRMNHNNPQEYVLDLIAKESINQQNFNHLQAGAKNPFSTGNNLLIFPDAFMDETQLKEQIRQGNIKRGGFNSLGGSLNPKSLANLKEVCDHFGIALSEARPVIGGNPLKEWDRSGSHGYWTANLFQYSSKLKSDADLKSMVQNHLQSGTKLSFDAAFVSHSLNSIHYMTNLRYPIDSPYLKFFSYDKLNSFPQTPLKIGLLPVKKCEKTGDEVVDDEAWDIRFIRPAKDPDHDESTWFIELYDPRLEDESGAKRPGAEQYKSSLYPYRFPISGKEAEKKLKELEGHKFDPVQSKNIKRYWSNFQFTTAIQDNSGYRWDGQADQVRFNNRHRGVIGYIADALSYWTQNVQNTYMDSLSAELTHLKDNYPRQSWAQLIQGVTTGKIKSPILKQTLSQLPKHKLNTIAHIGHQQPQSSLRPFAAIADCIKTDFPLAAIPATPHVQMTLISHTLRRILNEGYKSLPMRILDRLISGFFQPEDADDYEQLHKLPSGAASANKIKLSNTSLGKALTYTSFNTLLRDKLCQEIGDLPPRLEGRLADADMIKIVGMPIAKSVYYSILMGRPVSPTQVENLPPEEVARSIEANVPSFILNNSPKKAAKLLSIWMNDQMKSLDLSSLNIRQYVADQALKHDPEAMTIARNIMDKAQLGLHWRIDAMKDIADIDAIMSVDEHFRAAKTKQEIQRITENFYKPILQQVRKINPHSIVRPELTSTGPLVGKTKSYESEMIKALIQKNAFNGITNFDAFNQHFALVRANGRPDEGWNPKMLTPSAYIADVIKPMMQKMQPEQVFQYQNMMTNHDFSTSLYWLTLHPWLARTDHMNWYGLGKHQGEGLVDWAMKEVEHKTDLNLNPGLNHQQFEHIRSEIERVINQPERFDESIRPFLFHKDAGQGSGAPRPDHLHIPVPLDIKQKFVQQLWQQFTPQQFEVTPEQWQKLQKSLMQTLTEPSEWKASKGVMLNAINHIADHPEALQPHLKSGNNISGEQLKAIKTELIEGINTLSSTEPNAKLRWLGYQQFDFQLKQLFEKSNTISKLSAETQDGLLQGLYTQMIKPALDQYKRMAATLIPLPGDPTFYMPDLFGQAGGENYKNKYQGNRDAIRLDWVKDNPVIKKYYDELGGILRARKELPVLNTGHLFLPLDPTHNIYGQQAKEIMDNTGIMPLMRDDGQGNQVISLINTGKPQNLHDTFNQALEQNHYPEILPQTPVVKDYKLDCNFMNIPEGTHYTAINPENGKKMEMVVNNKGLLVQAQNPSKGLNISTTVHLVLKKEH